MKVHDCVNIRGCGALNNQYGTSRCQYLYIEGAIHCKVGAEGLYEITTIGTGTVTYGPNYQNGQSGDTSVPGVIDEMGAAASNVPALGGEEHLLFSVPFTANVAGLGSFTPDPPDVLPANYILVVGDSDPVPLDKIVARTLSVLIIGGG